MNKLIDDKVTLEYISTITLLCISNTKSKDFYNSILDGLVKEIIFIDNYSDAYKKFLERKIDVIITDNDGSESASLNVIEEIRKADKDIPIILVSTVDDVDIVVNALHLGVNSFVAKPIDESEIIEAVEKASKIIIANNVLEEERTKKLQELQEKHTYNSYQEDLGFAKELNILRNDFYYKMTDSKGITLVDFLYQPLDVMSGDAYCARRIDEHTTFYLMVDGMGKGLSASLSAMIMTSFINHILDKMLFLDSFDLSLLIHETMEYIKPVLLDEEALSIDYIVIDNQDDMLYYAKFAMPTLLMQNSNNEIIKLKSNNAPLSKYQETFNVSSYDISDIKKFLIYSDGIVENETIYKNRVYADFIEDDFLNAFTREDLKKSFLKKIDTQEDDITLIFINKLEGVSLRIADKTFSSTLDEVDNANEWYEDIWKTITEDTGVSYHAGLSFTELFMNAYEHGNLGLDSADKNRLLNNDIYFETLIEKEKDCQKNIYVKVDKIEHGSVSYIVTHITDEGDGFDTHILSEIFRNSQTFNGRGVFVSRKNSLGIYYNSKGNSVLYLNRI